MKDEVVKSSFWDYSSLVSSKFASFPLQILTVSIATRILGTEGYGTLALFLLISQLVFLFGVNWTSASVMRYGREEYVKEHKINKIFWGRNLIVLPSLIILFGGLILFKNRILNYIGMPQSGMWFLFLYIAGITLLNYVQYIQQAVGQLRLYALSNIAEKLLSAIGLLIILTVAAFPKNIFAVIAVYVLSISCVAFVFAGLIERKHFLPVEFNKEIIKKIFCFSYPIIFGSASASVVNWIDVIVIKKYMNISDVGVYTLSYQGMMVLQGISMSLIAVLGPIMVTFLVEDRQDLIVKFVKRIIPQGVLLWCLFLSLTIFLSPYLIPLIFGNSFSGSVLPFSILMLGLGFNCLACFCSPLLTAYELIKQSMAVNVLLALVNLAGDFLLVPKLGINGAAVATSFSFSLAAILYLVIINRRLKLHEWRQIFSATPIFVTVLAFLLFDNFWVKSSGLIFVLIISMILAKRLAIFRKDDFTMFSKVEIPRLVRQTINKTYSFLSV